MADFDYGVVARFDGAADGRFAALRDALTAAGYGKAIPEGPPHVSLATYEGVDVGELCRWTEEFAAKNQAFTVRIPALGVFPPGGGDTAVLYAAPAASENLIDFYYAFHEKLDEYCGRLGWLYSARFGFPAIHATVGIFDVADLPGATQIALSAPIFGEAAVTALEVYAHPMELIRRFELNRAAEEATI